MHWVSRKKKSFLQFYKDFRNQMSHVEFLSSRLIFLTVYQKKEKCCSIKVYMYSTGKLKLK